MSLQISHPTGNLHWFHWFVVISSLLLTLMAWYISKTQTEEKLTQRFEFQAQQLLDLVSERMSRYEDALRAGVAAVYSQQGNVDVNEWRRFADTLHIHESYPGINGIGIIYYIPPNKLNTYLAEERRFRPEYAIHPKHNNNEYWPITYVEPLKTNAKAIGLDMAFESNRLTAAKKARDSNSSQITAPIVLVQDAKKTPGFLQYVPFYRSKKIDTAEQRKQNFVGHVYAPFIMYKLIEGTLAQQNRLLLFSVYDGSDALYDELSPNNTYYDPKPLYSKEVAIDMYGRPWKFNIQTAKTFREGANKHQSTFILLGGIIIDSLLLFLFITLSRSYKRATSMAHKMTEKLAISEEYFRHIIEAAPCGILIVNQEGIIKTMNPNAASLLGYTPDELSGTSIDLIVPDSVREKHKNYRNEFWKTPKQRQMGQGREVHCRTKNGVLFPAEIGLAQFEGEDGLEVLATIIDMTTHVETTNELKRSNKELNDFAYVASHDLKAPLRGIMQLSNWIEEDTYDTASDETKTNLALLQNRTSRLEKLLDDLLSYSRIGRNLGEVKVVDIKNMLESLFELQEPPKGFTLICEGNMPVFETLQVPLEVIFRNLIGNAIKHHNKTEGTIIITVAEHPHTYEFSVKDDGPGIPPKLHANTFELFKTLRPRDEVEGSGMGLSIVQKMLEYHKSDIRIVSDGKNGSCFIFTWPKSITIGGNEKR